LRSGGEQLRRLDRNTFPGLLANVVAGRIANRFDLGGTNCVIDAACAGSLAAVRVAIQELSLGTSDMVVTGGVDALNDIVMYMCFCKTSAMSPTGDCRPFAIDADGTILGEGLGLFALRRLDDAERDGNKIYAVIRGLGASSDGRAKSIYAPRPEGQLLALQRAYEAAGYSPARSAWLRRTEPAQPPAMPRRSPRSKVSSAQTPPVDRGLGALSGR